MSGMATTAKLQRRQRAFCRACPPACGANGAEAVCGGVAAADGESTRGTRIEDGIAPLVEARVEKLAATVEGGSCRCQVDVRGDRCVVRRGSCMVGRGRWEVHDVRS